MNNTAASDPKDAGFTDNNKEIDRFVVIRGSSVSEKHEQQVADCEYSDVFSREFPL